MNKLILLLKVLLGRYTTVSGVMADFDVKVKQLEQVVSYQKEEQARQAERIAKAVKAQDKAQSESHKAASTIEALKAITSHTNQLSLADLKKEVK